MAAIIMPQVGQDLQTAVITEWKVRVGDIVKVGDVIALVESDDHRAIDGAYAAEFLAAVKAQLEKFE